MTALATTNLTLADWAKRTDPDGTIAKIAMLLSQTNVIQRDCVHKEGNLPTGDRVSVQTTLPSVTFRAINQGVTQSKGTTAQIDEACAIIEARSEIDVDLAILNGNSTEFRFSEDTMFIEAMNQAQANGLFYGNPAVDSKQFLGLAPRYNVLGGVNAQNIIVSDAAPTADQSTSAWLVGWGDNSIYCPFPRGSKMGLVHNDLGIETVYNESAAGATTAGLPRLRCYVSQFQWKTGLVVKDWRNAVRICNLDTADFGGLGGDQAPTGFNHILHDMVKATYRIPNPAAVRLAWYVNRSTHALMARIGMEKAQNVLVTNGAATQFGAAGSFLTCLGYPIHLCDTIRNNEAAVV